MKIAGIHAKQATSSSGKALALSDCLRLVGNDYFLWLLRPDTLVSRSATKILRMPRRRITAAGNYGRLRKVLTSRSNLSYQARVSLWKACVGATLFYSLAVPTGARRHRDMAREAESSAPQTEGRTLAGSRTSSRSGPGAAAYRGNGEIVAKSGGSSATHSTALGVYLVRGNRIREHSTGDVQRQQGGCRLQEDSPEQVTKPLTSQ